MKTRPLPRLIAALGVAVCLAGGSASVLAAPTLTEQTRDLRQRAGQYEHGEGVNRDIGRAIALYCEGARMGDAEAQFSLGWIHANGRGVPRNDELAAYFFNLAARQGHAHAERMLRFTGPPATRMPECLFDIEGRQAFPTPTTEQLKVIELVNRLAPEYGIYPRLALAIIRAESNFNPRALSPKMAQGLMQLIPETSQRFKVAKPFDPEQNVRGGLAYLRWLLAYFKGDVELVAAAYNAGERAVEQYAGVPPYPETRDYVKRIKGIFQKTEHPYDPAVVEPSTEWPRIRRARQM